MADEYPAGCRPVICELLAILICVGGDQVGAGIFASLMTLRQRTVSSASRFV